MPRNIFSASFFAKLFLLIAMELNNLLSNVTFVNSNEMLLSLHQSLMESSFIALDIETAYWWDKTAERVSLIQLGVQRETVFEVWVIDCFCNLNLKPLQEIMINSNIIKVIHNASFDVNKLRKLSNIIVENVFDTMLAARRSGEKGCSLEALAKRHLGISLDKTFQRSNWASRPLSKEQLNYAANDVIVTLLLYQKIADKPHLGKYKAQSRFSHYEERPVVTTFEHPVRNLCAPIPVNEVATKALIKIVMQFPGRYSVQSLAHCLGRDRAGLAGFIVDNAISKEAFIDHKEALTIIAELITKGYLVDRGYRLSIGQDALRKV